MASSGTITGAIRTGYAIQIVWNEDSQSIANNTTTITAKVQLVSTGSSYTINSSASKSGTLTINGTKYSFNFTASLSGNQTKTLYTKTVTISHNADGSKTCAFSCSCGINVTLGGTYYGNVTASGNGVFNTIARASKIASVTASVSVNGTNTCAVSITRASSSFTHTVVWKIGSYTYTATGVATSTSYAIPMTWLNAIPNATTGTATVQVTTYSGSTKIGSTVSTTFKITVPSTVVPSFSSVLVADTNAAYATQFVSLVQGKSKAKFTINATGAYSSTIKTYKTVIEGKNYSGATPTTAVLTGSGNVTAKITVTDSRGRTATVDKTFYLIPYKAPTITTFTATRCNADGVANYEGTYAQVVVNYTVAAGNNKNTCSYKLEYKATSGTTWTELDSGTAYTLSTSTITGSVFNTDSSYDLRITLKDYFTTVTRTIEIPTAFTLIDFNANGHALAFGKVSELTEGVEFALPVLFSHAESPSSATYLQSGQDLNDVLEPGFYTIPTSAISGTLLNKPWTSTATGGLIVLREGDGMGKCQIAHKLSKDESAIYERSYYQSAWGDWITVHNGKGKVLWSGTYYMTAGHVITFAEAASKQATGIVLVFSEYYDGEAKNQTFVSQFVHKRLITTHSGTGHSFWMANSNGTYIATKYLYIRDDGITGHANNNLIIEATSGITLTNNRFVLRYVIGV